MHTPFGPHCLPHAPQSNAFEVRSTHAPLQSVRPLAHCVAHADCEHTCIDEQVVPHMPQFFGSLVTSVHTVLQRICPDGQPHVPFVHCVPARQAMPQPPQFAGSLLMSTHERPHTVWFAAHIVVQAEFEHTCPSGQALPHLPQSFAFEVTSTQAPLQL